MTSNRTERMMGATTPIVGWRKMDAGSVRFNTPTKAQRRRIVRRIEKRTWTDEETSE
jgi:hypothetical protein